MKIRLASELFFDSIVDGTGLRTVIFTQGCPHQCKGCHNPQTWNKDGGFLIESEKIVKEIINNSIGKAITFSGGEPMEQPEACLEIINKLREKGYNDFWAYTGYTWEEIMRDENKLNFMRQLNVIVDGRFEESLKSYNLKFKGSKNQRIINVQKSLETNNIVLMEFN